MLSNHLLADLGLFRMIRAILPHRGTDDYGSGEFGAPRGDRTHKGIDYACYPGTVIESGVYGTVTKLGYPYAEALQYRYVEVTDSLRQRHRYFYVDPSVDVGEKVMAGDSIGVSQDIAAHYTNGVMKNHVHYEILDHNGDPVNPE